MSDSVQGRKKSRERALVNAFVRLANLPANIVREHEAPDFVLTIQGRRVGLEVTEVFIDDDGSGVRPKVKESIADNIVERARRTYEARRGKPLHVSIGLSSGAELLNASRREAADQIADFLLALDPPVGRAVAWEHRGIEKNGLPRQLTYLHVLAVSDEGMANWVAPKAGWVAPLTADFLQPYIDQKAAKCERYRQVTPEVWLLLAIPGTGPSQFFEPSGEVPIVASPFDRTYLLNLFPGTVQLLRDTVQDE